MNRKKKDVQQILPAPHLHLKPGAGSHEPYPTDRAERFMAHEFDILGSGWTRVFYGMRARGFEGNNYSDASVTLSRVLEQLPPDRKRTAQQRLELARACVKGYEPIDWHIDLKSGFRSPLAHHRELSYGQVDGVDMKVTADLSRLYQLPILGRAFQAANNRRCRDELLAQVFDWHAANPFAYGPAWRANMNVAIRAVNLVVAHELIRPSLDAQQHEHQAYLALLREILVQHRQYMCANLEFPEDSYHPNHYIANLAGLLVVCAYIRQWDAEAGPWFKLALRELCMSIDLQVQDDGFQFENATAYHALVLEMLSVSLILAARMHGRQSAAQIRDWIEAGIGAGRMRKLKMMFEVLAGLTAPSGVIPQIGDVDGGRLVYLEMPGHAADDWRFLSCLGAVLFNDSCLSALPARPEDWSAAEILLEPCSGDYVKTLPQSKAFADAGIYVIRDDDVFCAVSAGPIGTAGRGGHAHNDKLAFTLEVAGKSFLVDPGIYVYTASEYHRNLYRSVMAHNTAVISGREQNRFARESKWWGCCEETHCQCLEWRVSPAGAVFAGEHRGYMGLEPGLMHQRRIEYNRQQRELMVRDRFPCAGGDANLRHTQLLFMLHPACSVKITGNT